VSQVQKAFTESGTSPPLRVTLKHVQMPGSTVGIGVGHDAEGNAITFAGDWRPLVLCAEAFDAGEEVRVVIDDRQAIARRQP
jgi:hypothetical protein